MLWSFLVVLSYWAYSNPAFQENFWLIALEYIAVIGFAIWELMKDKNKSPILNFQKSNYL